MARSIIRSIEAMTAQHFTVNRTRRTQLGLRLGPRKPRATTIDDHRRESEVQRDAIALLAKHPSVAFAHRINSRVLDVADKNSKTGTRPMRTAPKGHPDIAGMLKDGRALYIECKSSAGTVTDEQMAFIQRVNQFDGLAFIARSIDDVLRHLPLPTRDEPSAVLKIM